MGIILDFIQKLSLAGWPTVPANPNAISDSKNPTRRMGECNGEGCDHSAHFSRLFGGSGSEPCNALMSALENASVDHGYGSIYEYLDRTPKTSLVVELVESLGDLGYEIARRPV